MLDSQHYQFFSEEKIVDIAEVNQRRCLEESGQWFEKAEQTYLLLASGKLVLQKSLCKKTLVLFY